MKQFILPFIGLALGFTLTIYLGIFGMIIAIGVIFVIDYFWT